MYSRLPMVKSWSSVMITTMLGLTAGSARAGSTAVLTGDTMITDVSKAANRIGSVLVLIT
jgi:hypothetical protein